VVLPPTSQPYGGINRGTLQTQRSWSMFRCSFFSRLFDGR
jgi:hypothetical protein